MAISGSTWREHPFTIGQTYIAAQSFSGFPTSNFVAGQAYELLDIAHSHYDGCTIFTFRHTGNGAEPSYWWWSDEEPETLCRLRFRVGT